MPGYLCRRCGIKIYVWRSEKELFGELFIRTKHVCPVCGASLELPGGLARREIRREILFVR